MFLFFSQSCFFLFPTCVGFLKAWRNWPALFVQHQYLELDHCCLPVSAAAKSAWRNWQTSTEQATFVADMYKQNVLAKHEMFEKFGGGETSKKAKDMLLKLSPVRQTVLVSFART